MNAQFDSTFLSPSVPITQTAEQVTNMYYGLMFTHPTDPDHGHTPGLKCWFLPQL